MSSPSNDTAPSVSDATPPVPPASPQKRPLLRASSVIDLTGAAAEPTEEEAGQDTQEAKRARDESFKAVVEDSRRTRVRDVLTKIASNHLELVSAVHELCVEKEYGEFVREVEFMFSLSFSETFCAIGNHAKSK